jgi:hypothetical protein
LQREDSAVAMTSDYEDIPKASAADLLTIWHASTTSCPPTGRKVQLNLEQPAGQNMSLRLGSYGTTLYTMQTNSTPTQSTTDGPTTDLSIQKSCPSSTIPMPVSQLSLPPNPTKTSATSPPTTLFPHQARSRHRRHRPYRLITRRSTTSTKRCGTSPAPAHLHDQANDSRPHRRHCAIHPSTFFSRITSYHSLARGPRAQSKNLPAPSTSHACRHRGAYTGAADARLRG